MRIDTDVHCAPSSWEALSPYLDAYWRDYIDDATVSLAPAVGASYPPAAPTSATEQARATGTVPPDTVDALRRQLLDGSDLTHAILNCVTAFTANRNPYFETALCRAINDWLVAEWLEQDSRLRASIVVPTQDVTAAVAEIERIGGDPRFTQVLLPIRGQDVRYGHLRFRPLLEAASAHNLVLGLHAWGRVASGPTFHGSTHTYLEDYLSNSQVVQGQVVSLIAEGVFEALPDLRVCLAECGFTWVPSLFWRFDKEWKGIWREVPWVRASPSEYFYRHFRLTTQPAQLPADERQCAEVLEMLRPDKLLMHASDHPHDHGKGVERLHAALDAPATVAVNHTNAAALYELTS